MREVLVLAEKGSRPPLVGSVNAGSTYVAYGGDQDLLFFRSGLCLLVVS